MSAADRAALERLYVLYLHDLSEFTGYYALDEDARWQPSHLEDMLARPECHCLLARAQSRAAGFALVGLQPFPYMPVDVDAKMIEFFVARPFRRQGIGRELALGSLRRYPGRWDVTEIDANVPAIDFWRRAIGELTGGDYTEVVGVGELSQRFSTG